MTARHGGTLYRRLPVLVVVWGPEGGPPGEDPHPSHIRRWEVVDLKEVTISEPFGPTSFSHYTEIVHFRDDT